MAGMELRSSGQRMTRQSTRQTSNVTTTSMEKKHLKVPTSKVTLGVNATTTPTDNNKEIKNNPSLSMPIRRSSRSISNHSDCSGSKRPTRSAVLNSILKPAFASLIDKRRSSTVKTYSRASTKNKQSTNSLSKTLQSTISSSSSTSQIIPNTTLSEIDNIPIQNEEKLDEQQEEQQIIEKNDDNESLLTTTATTNEEGNLEDKLEYDNLMEYDNDDDEIADKEIINYTNDNNNNNSVANQVIEDDSMNTSNLVNVTSPICKNEGDNNNNNNTQVSFVLESDNNNNTSDENSKHSSVTSIKDFSEHIENYLDYEIDIQIEEFFYCDYCGCNFINHEKFQDHKLKKCPENNEEIEKSLECNDDDDDEEQDEEYAEDPLRIYEDECEFECSPIFSKLSSSSSSSSSNESENNCQINSIDEHDVSYSNNNNTNTKANNTKYLFAASAYKYYVTTSINKNKINHDTNEYDNDLIHMRTSTAQSHIPSSYYNHEKSPDQKSNTFSKITILPPDYMNTGRLITSPATTKILVPLKNFMLSCKRPVFVFPVDNQPNGETTPLNNSTDATTTSTTNSTTQNVFDSTTMIEISPTIDNSVTSNIVIDNSNRSSDFAALTNNNAIPSTSVSCGRSKSRKTLRMKQDGPKLVDPLDVHILDHTYFNHTEIEDKTKNEKKMTTMENRHKQHLTAEQLRRQNLRLLFQTLKHYMPKHYKLNPNSSKVIILKKSIEYIKTLENAEKTFRLEKVKLVEKNQKLWDTFNSFSKDELEESQIQHPASILKTT